MKGKERLYQSLSMTNLMLNVNFFNGFSHCSALRLQRQSYQSVSNSTRGQTSDKISLYQLKARIYHAVRECQIIQYVREYQKLRPYFEGFSSPNNAKMFLFF